MMKFRSKLVEKMLRRIGHDVVEEVNGREALDRLLKVDGPRLALLDQMIPEMNGPTVCQNMRTLSHAIEL